MKINKTYKFKLKLTAPQERRINHWIGSCRYLYNTAKECREWAYKSYGKSLNYYDLSKELPALKKQETWLADIPAGTLQDVLERQEKAFKSFFTKKSSYPKWATKKAYNSVTVKSVKHDTKNRVIIPKIGSIKYFNSQEMEGELKRATIIKEVDEYYICILSKVDVPTCQDAQFCDNQAIGIDVGISYFAVTSDGEFIENPIFLKYALLKLRKEQRSLSRKTKKSNNWYKQLNVVQKLHKKISNQRKDFLHKTSTRFVQENIGIVVEDLNIRGMVKSRLAQSISDVAWGEFQRQLEYKSNWANKTFIKVNAQYTSQECSNCGHTAKENRLTQSQFKCVSCGHTANADEDAAKTILGRGTTYVTERKTLV